MPITTQPIPTGYKSSPLGPIPQDWEIKSLLDCCLIKGEYGINAPATDFTENLPTYIRITDIDDDGNYSAVKKASVNDENSGKFVLENGDILFARTGATVGKSYLYNEKDGKLVFAGFLIRFRPDEDILLAKYLKYFTSTKPYWDRVKTVSMRSGQPGINAEEYGSLKLIIPPLPEQTAIANILSTTDNAIQKTQEIIKKLETRNNGLVQKLLTGKTRVKGFYDKWNNIQFKEIYLQFKEKSTEEKYEILSVTKDKIVSQSEYFNKEIASEDKSGYLIVKKGDFVMSGLNFWMGAAHVVENFEIGIVSPAYKTFRIHNKNISKEFMRFFVESNIMRRALVGSSVQGASIVRRNLDQEMLESWIFKIPSIQEQETIANILNSAEKELNIYKQKLTKLQIIKKGLMQQLLTGKVRVKEFRK